MFIVSVYAIEADASDAELVRSAYDDLASRIRVSLLDRDALLMPEPAASQTGPSILIASSRLLRLWFGGAKWAVTIARWAAAGGKALIVHPDTSSGPLDWPQVELGHAPPDAREHSLREFLDTRRDLTLRFDAAEEDDAAGALEHARGLVAWQRADTEPAAEHFRRALAERGALHEGDPRRAATANALGAALLRAGRIAESLPFLEDALTRRTAWLGTDSPQTAASANNLGLALLRSGQPARAASLLAHAADAMLDLGPAYEARARACAAHAAAASRAAGDRMSADGWARVACGEVAREHELLLN